MSDGINAPLMGLSLRQPWGFLVVQGLKPIENRVWNTRRRGPFLIHASAGCTRKEYEAAVAFARAIEPNVFIPPLDTIERGGFIGRASITNVIPPCAANPPRAMPGGFAACECGRPWHMGSQFGFELAQVARTPFVTFAASQRWFRVPDRIRVQLESSPTGAVR